MHNLDDKRPTRSGFEPSTSEFRATAEANKPSGPATYFSLPGTRRTENMGTIYLLVWDGNRRMVTANMAFGWLDVGSMDNEMHLNVAVWFCRGMPNADIDAIVI